MSKTSKKYAEELYHRILESREVLKRTLTEYRDSIRDEADRERASARGAKLRLERSLERAVAKYSKLCKAFDQLQETKAKK